MLACKLISCLIDSVFLWEGDERKLYTVLPLLSRIAQYYRQVKYFVRNFQYGLKISYWLINLAIALLM